MMVVRRHSPRREDDPWWMAFVSGFFRWRGISTLVWMLGASIGTLVLAAWRYGPKLDKAMARITILEVRDDVREKQMRVLPMLLRSSCLDRTKVEQEMIDMTCADSLFKHEPHK